MDTKKTKSYSIRKEKANIVTYFKIAVSDTTQSHTTLPLQSYRCIECYFKEAATKDLNRLANVIRDRNCEFRDVRFNFKGMY